eukprot:1161615-Pelagomonas_calceolata.AAC.8
MRNTQLSSSFTLALNAVAWWQGRYIWRERIALSRRGNRVLKSQITQCEREAGTMVMEGQTGRNTEIPGGMPVFWEERDHGVQADCVFWIQKMHGSVSQRQLRHVYSCVLAKAQCNTAICYTRQETLPFTHPIQRQRKYVQLSLLHSAAVLFFKVQHCLLLIFVRGSLSCSTRQKQAEAGIIDQACLQMSRCSIPGTAQNLFVGFIL